MKASALALLLSLTVAPITFAQTRDDAPASKEDIQRYFDTMHTHELTKKMMDAMVKQVHQLVHEQIGKLPNLPPDFEARQDKMIDDTLRSIPVDDLIQAMIPVYEKHLTKGDVDALLTFYSTPRGQKILNELPTITAEAMQASSGIMKKTIAQAMQRVQEDIAEAQRSGSGGRQN